MTNCLPKLLITGGDGQVANALRHHPLARQFQLINCSRQELDITDECSIENNFIQHAPQVVINTAAYTAVDKAETEVELAMQINHHGARNMAAYCEKFNIPLIHLSTDYIFSGTKTTPYLEEDIAEPLSIYGQSKWLGEKAIRAICENHLILRVSGIFSQYGYNFVKTILRLAKEKETLKIVNDQITCPTFAGDIAEVLLTLSALVCRPEPFDCGPELFNCHPEPSSCHPERFDCHPERSEGSPDQNKILRCAQDDSKSSMAQDNSKSRVAQDDSKGRVAQCDNKDKMAQGDSRDRMTQDDNRSRISQHDKTYHYCSQQPISWYEFALALLNNRADIKTREIIPITSKEYHAPAARPTYSVLDCSKLYRDYGISQPCWQSTLKEIA